MSWGNIKNRKYQVVDNFSLEDLKQNINKLL